MPLLRNKEKYNEKGKTTHKLALKDHLARAPLNDERETASREINAY